MLKSKGDGNIKILVITEHSRMQDVHITHAAKLRLAQRNGHTTHGHLQHFLNTKAS